ncbi:uncharacterized protein EV420DRAFT_1677810 [Desarmillaria tabescens]|uniref:Uncharacterized protein n=1 Tax=Armillaria tabescens TaxID=1929756 RepID=A0AA39KDX7_ARMTA|nr:uncharacterized protein EV420DRAFT_1677810 [Desarmillaria tabescens]KAK0459325.1 hypothetical protein EV420DRAFT_1677810 [Desarmillaria tabescens]
MVHWIMFIVPLWGVPIQSTDKTHQVIEAELKTTSFAWLEPADDGWIKGVTKDEKVETIRVPEYAWLACFGHRISPLVNAFILRYFTQQLTLSCLDRAPKEFHTGYSKIFTSIGNAEAYQRECEQFAEQMRSGGVHVTLDVQKGSVHDFFRTALSVILPEVARARVLENAKARLEKHAATTQKIQGFLAFRHVGGSYVNPYRMP